MSTTPVTLRLRQQPADQPADPRNTSFHKTPVVVYLPTYVPMHAAPTPTSVPEPKPIIKKWGRGRRLADGAEM